MNKKLYSSLEFFTLFLLLPLIILFFSLHKYFLLFLWGFGLYCYFILKSDPSFDKRSLLNLGKVNKHNLKIIFSIFIVAAILISVGTYIFEGERFLQLPLTRPILWIAIMFLYPLLSVYPQEIIYRAFIFHRYKEVFNSESKRIIISSLVFGYVHIIFQNFVAIIMCMVGGYLFSRNYSKNRSLILVCMEHALYGCFIFTIGLGWYFYRGSVGIR